MKVLLTSGGTKVMIDEVRNVGNMSNGTFGEHICRSLLSCGHNVDFLFAKGSKAPHEFRVNLRDNLAPKLMKELLERIEFLDKHWSDYNPVEYYDFNSYRDKLYELLSEEPDVVVLAAAVSDFAPKTQAKGKIDSNTEKMVIEFEQTPKLIRMVREACPLAYLVGFKLLVGSTQEELEEAMKKQIAICDCNLVVGNDIRDIRSNSHKLTLMYKSGKVEYVHNYPGETLASILVQRIQTDMVYNMTEITNSINEA